MALTPWQVHFARHFLLKYLTSAWESAEGNYILLPGPSVAHCQGIVKEAMATYWRKCKNVNLHNGHFVRKGSGAVKLYKVSKAVDALNREPERCKFML